MYMYIYIYIYVINKYVYECPRAASTASCKPPASASRPDHPPKRPQWRCRADTPRPLRRVTAPPDARLQEGGGG